MITTCEDLDLEVDRRLNERLPDVILAVLKRYALELSPWWAKAVPDWHRDCPKHGALLFSYTIAAINSHRAHKRYDAGLTSWDSVEREELIRIPLRQRQHDAPCHCTRLRLRDGQSVTTV